MCGLAIALPQTVAVFVPIATSVDAHYAKLAALAPFEPGHLKRPPKSIV